MSKQAAIGAKALAIVRHFYPSVNKVRDADEPITVEVTEKDEKASKRKEHADCAFAVACKRQEGLQGVIIAKSTAYLVKQRVAIRYAVPEAISREIVSFDRGADFEPGTYKLSPFGKSYRLGQRHGEAWEGTHREKGGAVKRFRHITGGVRTSLGRDE